MTPYNFMDLGHYTSSGNGLLPDSTKPLPKLMLTLHQLNPQEQISMKFHSQLIQFSLKKIHLKIVHFVQPSIC